MTSEKFCLRWNDFESNVSVAFRELREEKDFFDVTLACDDNQVQAHKVILSACSPFFRNILRKNPHQHPLLYLKGVKYQELLSVLNFMYQGEVNVAQEELNSFLAVAEDLRVKGLTQGSNQGSKQDSRDRLRDLPPDREPGGPPPPKKSRPALAPKPPTPSFTPSSHSYQDDDIQEVAPVKSEPRDPLPSAPHQSASIYDSPQPPPPQGGTVALDDESYAEYGDGAYEDGQYGEEGFDSSYYDPSTGAPLAGDGNKEKVDGAIYESLDLGGQRLYSCSHCAYHSTRRADVRKHVETRHTEARPLPCPYCHKVCANIHALKKHQQRLHRADVAQ